MSEYPKTSPDEEYVASGRGHAPRYNSVEKIFNCSLCGEPFPWYAVRGVSLDSWGARKGMDMTYADANRFFKGEGCPSCEFGRHNNRLFIERR